MSKKDEALKLALEALEKQSLHELAADSLSEGLSLDDWAKIGCVNHDCDKCKALAEQPAQQQEPNHVATVSEVHLSRYTIEWVNGPLPEGAKLYDAPQPAQQQPVAILNHAHGVFTDKCTCKHLPLTDEQFLELLLKTGSTELVSWATFVGGSIQMQGRIGLLRGAKLCKEFIEAHYGITGEKK